MSTPRSPKKPAAERSSPKTPAEQDPTSDEALLALPPAYADAPDMPVGTAVSEIASLSRLARAQKAKLAGIGVTAEQIDTLAALGRRLSTLERAWQKARGAVKLTPAEKKLVAEAEKLDGKLVSGGRWACRDDADAQAELTRIADGSGIDDTIRDLRELIVFWDEHKANLGKTKITPKDLARAAKLADSLDEAAAKEASDVEAAGALELRNRAFWAADALAKTIREGGRYANDDQPKLAAKFVSRYRASANRRSRAKAKAAKGKVDKGKKEPVG